MQVDRREFLSLRAGQPAVLSCERLYMRYVDALAGGTTRELFDRLAMDLRSCSTVRLTDTAWLADDDMKAGLDSVLAAFTAHGGRVRAD